MPARKTKELTKIGLLVGREWSWPPAFIEEVQRRDADVIAEFVKLGGTQMNEPNPYRVIVDRISHEVPYYRSYLKNAVVQGAKVINDPFMWTADDKFFGASLADRLGVASPKTLVLPNKDYVPGIIPTESLRNLVYPLDRQFITSMPTAGGAPLRARRPFPDEVARALADEDNLARLAGAYDPEDQGLRDIWETIVTTGRRTGEVLNLRWDCIGRYGNLPMFWHDQTKVGNYDASIRIPERLYDLLAARQAKTADRFISRFGRRPASAERAAIALFPSKVRNTDATMPISYQWFHSRFKPRVEGLDLGRWVPHQARHTLATSLLRHGASLTHIRRYLGQVSDRMAEHYVHLSHSDLENVLQHVWVAGPGTASPGELLAGTAAPLSQAEAQALAVDLSRRSTPAEGGFCTFQPVVDGGACPWNLNCHSCDRFVLSGADLLYWRRKREQWRQLAEGAPDDATASYLHDYFEPTARAIDGLEKALAGLGLLGDALALDLRKPQDYFQRVWNTAFLAADLARAGSHDGQYDSTDAAGHGDPPQLSA